MKISQFPYSDYFPLSVKQSRRGGQQDAINPPLSNPRSQKRTAAGSISDETVERIAERVIEKQQEDVQEKVRQTAEKAHIVSQKEGTQRLNNPSRTLFHIKAVFPFDFFPDEVLIEESKVNVINRTFFFSAQIQSMSFKDIKKVEVETSIFFAKLRLTSWTMIDNHIDVSFLTRSEALKARRIIEGLKGLSEQKIDLTGIPTEDLLEKVENLGRIT